MILMAKRNYGFGLALILLGLTACTSPQPQEQSTSPEVVQTQEVSHNMDTVRSLCDRCIVLDGGRVVYDGDVEQGIDHYMMQRLTVQDSYDFTDVPRKGTAQLVRMQRARVSQKEHWLNLQLDLSSKESRKGLHLRLTVANARGTPVATAVSQPFASDGTAEQRLTLTLDTDALVSGTYSADLAVVEPVGDKQQRHDFLEHAIAFTLEKEELPYRVQWPQQTWGSVRLPVMRVEHRA